MPLDRADPARAAGAARLPEPVELAAYHEVSEALTEAAPKLALVPVAST